MNNKKKKIFSIVVCALFLFIIFASLFYIVKESDHHCTGEDCPICASIHHAEQTLRNLGTGTITNASVTSFLVLFVSLMIGSFYLVSNTTLVEQKVRLNN